MLNIKLQKSFSFGEFKRLNIYFIIFSLFSKKNRLVDFHITGSRLNSTNLNVHRV